MTPHPHVLERVDGEWQPAVPLPFFRGWLLGQYQCGEMIDPDEDASGAIIRFRGYCCRRFRTREAYEAHYREEHL